MNRKHEKQKRKGLQTWNVVRTTFFWAEDETLLLLLNLLLFVMGHNFFPSRTYVAFHRNVLQCIINCYGTLIMVKSEVSQQVSKSFLRA